MNGVNCRVNSSDVDEAIRLMHGSKASLRPELRERQAKESPKDIVWGLLRQMRESARGGNRSDMEWDAILQKVRHPLIFKLKFLYLFKYVMINCTGNSKGSDCGGSGQDSLSLQGPQHSHGR